MDFFQYSNLKINVPTDVIFILTVSLWLGIFLPVLSLAKDHMKNKDTKTKKNKIKNLQCSKLYKRLPLPQLLVYVNKLTPPDLLYSM